MIQFKLKAELFIQAGLKDGTLVKPPACEFCGRKTKSLVAQHQDNAQVKCFNWLCTKCVKSWERDHEFVLHFFRGDVPKDVVELTMKKYFRHFHIETTKTLSTYIGILAK